MELITFYNKIKGYGQQRGLILEDAEDFACGAVILRMGGRKATFGQLYIDFIRSKLGDSRNGNFEEKNAFNLPLCAESLWNLGYECDIDTKIFVGNALDKLRKKDKYLMKLRFYYGLSYADIGQLTGRAAPSVMVDIQVVLDKLKVHLRD